MFSGSLVVTKKYYESIYCGQGVTKKKPLQLISVLTVQTQISALIALF